MSKKHGAIHGQDTEAMRAVRDARRAGFVAIVHRDGAETVYETFEGFLTYLIQMKPLVEIGARRISIDAVVTDTDIQ